MLDISANMNIYSANQLLQQHLANKASDTRVRSLNDIKSIATNAVTEVSGEDNASDFASILNTEMSNLDTNAQMAELVSVLDKSVLGSMDETNLAALSQDLLGTSGGRNVLASLVEGQFTGMIFDSGNASDEDENSVINTMSQLSDSLSSQS